jgi:hypothetical protein
MLYQRHERGIHVVSAEPGRGGGDCHNMDSWDSEEAFNQFGQERLGPAMARAGVQAELRVTFHPAHEVYLPQAVTITG